MKLELIALAVLIVFFGCFALYLGYNSVVISSVFGALGAIGGYIVKGYLDDRKEKES